MSNGCSRICIHASEYDPALHTIIASYATEEECAAACECSSESAANSSSSAAFSLNTLGATACVISSAAYPTVNAKLNFPGINVPTNASFVNVFEHLVGPDNLSDWNSNYFASNAEVSTGNNFTPFANVSVYLNDLVTAQPLPRPITVKFRVKIEWTIPGVVNNNGEPVVYSTNWAETNRIEISNHDNDDSPQCSE